MNKPIRKAVLPVAGLGTRFLPATKAVPKEMLTIVDRPIIQYVVDEARAAGIEHIVFVTGRNKHVIEDHFDMAYELEDTLKARNKAEALALLEQHRPQPGSTSFTRQQAPLGLGHAIWCARDIIGDEPFAILLPDVIIKSQVSCLKQMVNVYEQTGGNIIAVEEVPEDQTHQYGIVELAEELTPNAHKDHQYGRKAEAGNGAVQPADHGPLHSPAGDLRSAVETGHRRGRRDPADRQHAGPDENAVLRIAEIRGPQL